MLLPLRNLLFSRGGKFTAGNQQPFAIRKNFRGQRGRGNRQYVDAVALAGAFCASIAIFGRDRRAIPR